MDRRDFLKGLLAAPAALASFKGLEALTPAEVPAKLVDFNQELTNEFDSVGILSMKRGGDWEGVGFVADLETTRSLNGRVNYSIGQLEPVSVGFGIDDSTIRARLCAAPDMIDAMLTHEVNEWRVVLREGEFTWKAAAAEASVHVAGADQPIYTDVLWMVLGAVNFEPMA